MQQRYYDPQAGRFLSVDPVPTSPKRGTNFGRYSYANDNPYRYIDPDGRYVCSDPVACKAAASGLAAITKALGNTSLSAAAHAALVAAKNFYGAAGEKNGVYVKSGKLDPGTKGEAMTYGGVQGEPKGLKTEITLDVNQAKGDTKATGVALGLLLGGTMVHEGKHGQIQRSGDGNVTNVKSEIRAGEVASYTAGAMYWQGAGADPWGYLFPNGRIDYGAVYDGAARSTEAQCATGNCVDDE